MKIAAFLVTVLGIIAPISVAFAQSLNYKAGDQVLVNSYGEVTLQVVDDIANGKVKIKRDREYLTPENISPYSREDSIALQDGTSVIRGTYVILNENGELTKHRVEDIANRRIQVDGTPSLSGPLYLPPIYFSAYRPEKNATLPNGNVVERGSVVMFGYYGEVTKRRVTDIAGGKIATDFSFYNGPLYFPPIYYSTP